MNIIDPRRREQQREILSAIHFYSRRGWDWIPLVGYLAATADGRWPPTIIRTAIGAVGHPRGSTKRKGAIQ